MTEDEYGALLRHVYEFPWRVAAGSGKSADPILHRESPLLKYHIAMRWSILKIKDGLAYLSLDLIYDLTGKSQKLFRENVPLSCPLTVKR
jgi:hypothetical protein